MISETRNCQNCKAQFTIEPEDFEFYNKIKVPPPTFCPKCRLQRRLAFYNLFSLYKRKCDLCKKDLISIYPPDLPYTVYCPACWWSDKWDPFQYGRDYDFSRPFFQQLKDLWREVPVMGISIALDTYQTSPYTNHVSHLKNCYLVFQASESEDCFYGMYILFSKTILDSSLIYSCERMFDSSNCYRVNNGIGNRVQVTESLDCSFLRNSHNCQNCFASANLRNKKYVAFNKQYTKEEYFNLIRQYDLGSYKTYKTLEARVRECWKQFPPDPDVSTHAVDCTGSHIFESKQCKECYETVGAEDSKFMLLIGTGPVRDCYDVSSWGENMSLCYECMNCGLDVSGVRFSKESGQSVRNAEYCSEVVNCSNVFACAEIRKSEYAIFNKRYSKEEYEILRGRIIRHMDEMPYTDVSGIVYRYGEYFPPDMSQFGYNITVAANFEQLSRDDAIGRGYKWHEEETPIYSITKTAKELSDHIRDVPDSITNEVIGCESCGRGFRILKEELAMRRQMNVPLARECPFCRINKKMGEWVKKMRVGNRVCAKCSTVFPTHYMEEEAPYILCKSCYNKEVV